MSGRGAPSRTPTPIPVRAMSVRLPATTAPWRITSSTATSVMITTSTGSPLASLPRVTPTVPNESATPCPVSRRKASDSSVTIARTAPALNTFRSSARAGVTPVEPTPAAASATASHHRIPRTRVLPKPMRRLLSRGRDESRAGFQVVELPPRGPAHPSGGRAPQCRVHRGAVRADPLGEGTSRRLRAHQAAGDRQLAQHHEAYLPVGHERREAVRGENRIQAVEAAHRHHREAGGDDERRGQLRARGREQEALAVAVGLEEGDELAPIGGLPQAGAGTKCRRGRRRAEPSDVGGGNHRHP